MKKLLSILLTVVLLISSFAINYGHNAKAEQTTQYSQGDILYWGMFPQTKVTDSETLEKLENASWSDVNTAVLDNGHKYTRLYKNSTYTYYVWESIEWKVFYTSNNNTFLVSTKALDDRRMNSSNIETWEDTELSLWLNNTTSDDGFINAHFSEAEFEKMHTVNGLYGNIMHYSWVTREDYGKTINDTLVKTDYASARDVNSNSDFWWTRGINSGDDVLSMFYPNYAIAVTGVGKSDLYTQNNYFYIRPVIGVYSNAIGSDVKYDSYTEWLEAGTLEEITTTEDGNQATTEESTTNEAVTTTTEVISTNQEITTIDETSLETETTIGDIKENETSREELSSYDVTTQNNETSTVDKDTNTTTEAKVEYSGINKMFISLVKKTYVYNGKVKTPKVSVKNGTAVLKEGVDYYLQYRNNKKPGKASIEIRGMGKYTGVVVKDFTIKPAKVKKLKLSKVKKSVKLKWKKVKYVSGYQVQLSKNKKFKGKKKKYIVKNNKKSVLKKKLYKKKTYYRVRAYVFVGNKKVYGKWSAIKKVKIKK